MLLETQDLDPLYVALVKTPMPPDQMKRWLFTYWCCYHAGASCYLSEFTGDRYWAHMLNMAANVVPNPLGTRWPRGHERRHFRGAKAVDAVGDYADIGTPEEIVGAMIAAGPVYRDIREQVTRLPQFGPWIAFKVGDMLERVLGVPVDFAEADVLMFDQPFKSALAVYADEWALPQTGTPKEAVTFVSAKLQGRFYGHVAPPHIPGIVPRRVGLQEVETMLCKWKSHKSGHYPVGIDSHDLRAGLAEWATVSATARDMAANAPKGDLDAPTASA